MEELNDARMLAIAAERMSSYDPAALISEKEMSRRPGITEEESDSVDEADFE